MDGPSTPSLNPIVRPLKRDSGWPIVFHGIWLLKKESPELVVSELPYLTWRSICGRSLDGPGLCAAQQSRRRKARKSRPVGNVEACAGVNVCRVGGRMLFSECLYHLATGCVLLGLRRARPVDEKPLSAHLATDITDGIGNLAENLHISHRLSGSFTWNFSNVRGGT